MDLRRVVLGEEGVRHDPHTRKSRGVGFVTIGTVQEAEAITAFNGTEIVGNIVTVEGVCTVTWERFSALLSALTIVGISGSTWACMDTHAGRYYGTLKRHDCMSEFIRCRGTI